MCISRLETINKLKNKHGKSIEELIQYKKQLDEKLSSIQSADNIKETLEKKLAKHQKSSHFSLRKSFAYPKRGSKAVGGKNNSRT